MDTTSHPDRPDEPESVAWIDEHDNVIEFVPRSRMRAERLRHRAVFVAVTDGSGRILVHRRSPAKDVWPGWCDIAVGGVVTADESYDEAARRELAEEIGLVGIEPEPIDGGVPRPYDDETVSLLGRCYQVVSTGPFTFADGEIVDAWWVARDAMTDAIGGENFLPDSIDLVLPLVRW